MNTRRIPVPRGCCTGDAARAHSRIWSRCSSVSASSTRARKFRCASAWSTRMSQPIDDFAKITRLIVSRRVIACTERTLRAAGQHDAEGIVLWAGRRDGDIFRITDAYVPEQTARPAHLGACVMVSGEALFRFNMWMWDRGFEFIAQVHSHPEEAYLSATDVAYPIATRVGSFSLVVPNFGREPFAFDD